MITCAKMQIYMMQMRHGAMLELLWLKDEEHVAGSAIGKDGCAPDAGRKWLSALAGAQPWRRELETM